MNKVELKQVLVDLIYTPDAKPRFVGGDLDTKLAYIDEAVEKITKGFQLTRADKVLEFISFDDDKDATIEAVKLLLKLDNLTDKTEMLDHAIGEDEYVIEQFEYTFTVQDFLNHIE